MTAKKIIIKFLVLLFIIIQFTAAKAQNADSVNAVMPKLIALRDDFINKIKAFGYTPDLAPPEIILDNPRSFGNYENEKNLLHIGEWNALPPNLKEIFNARATEIGNGMTGENYFNLSIHRWVFIHELGHWWRACQHQKALPYANESAANRIALAYWREQDSAFLNFMLIRFQNNIKNIPNPAPAGEQKEKYLNENYQKLPGGPAYIWYQATMIVDANNEKPIVSFRQAIDRAGNTTN